jgi:probable selenium-dependent hydroxylase accessory protein YqeC
MGKGIETVMKKQSLSKALNLQMGDRLALVGGGGKTSILYTLAKENIYSKGLYTTSTKMYDPSSGTHPFHRLLLNWQEEDCPLPLQKIESCFIASGRMKGTKPKVIGLSNNRINSWKSTEAWPILVIEADGAAGRPVKAPNEGEPVIPRIVNRVIGCIGLDALGKKIEPPWVHRPELFRERFCRKGQQRIDPEILMELIRHPEGLFKNSPVDSTKTVIFNKLDCLDSSFEIEKMLEDFKRDCPSHQFLALSLI